MADPERCACGLPLHYSRPEVRDIVEHLNDLLGDGRLRVTVAGLGTFRVQRHYIALHGLNAVDLPRLAAAGIVERIAGEAP